MTEKQSLFAYVVRELTGTDISHLEGQHSEVSEQQATHSIQLKLQRARIARLQEEAERLYPNNRNTGRTSIWVRISDAAQLVGDSLVNVLERLHSRRAGLDTPPGCQLNSWARFVYPKKTYERVFMPLIADVQAEYIEALDQGQHGKAQWIRWRGRAAFWTAVVARVPVAFAAWVKTALKSAGS